MLACTALSSSHSPCPGAHAFLVRDVLGPEAHFILAQQPYEKYYIQHAIRSVGHKGPANRHGLESQQTQFLGRVLNVVPAKVADMAQQRIELIDVDALFEETGSDGA